MHWFNDKRLFQDQRTPLITAVHTRTIAREDFEGHPQLWEIPTTSFCHGFLGTNLGVGSRSM